MYEIRKNILEKGRLPVFKIEQNPEFNFNSYDSKDWDLVKKSQLIESLLFNFPIPPVYLFEDDYNLYSVVDGKQRLLAIIDFLQDRFPLEGLIFDKQFNGLKFNKLADELRTTLRLSRISVVYILSIERETFKEEIIKRLHQ